MTSAINELRREVAALARMLSPWIEPSEMQARYNVCGKTLLAMERRGQIPARKNGRWSRVEVMEWESSVEAR